MRKQSEFSEQFENTIKTANKYNVNIIQVKAKDVIKIENDLYFEILWPKPDKTITKNPLNNNSIVAKLKYKNFSMLFTGDIEKTAEEAILEEYENISILQSTILKVAHHGSNTSSTEQFIEKVNPKIALIGVGENNSFGHPHNTIIELLKAYGTKIYRTDKDGEITLQINKQGKINIITNF